MSILIKQQTRYYTQIVTLLGLIAIVTIGGCLSLLLLRQKIENSARETQALSQEIEREERRIRYLDTKIAEVHQPVYLQKEINRLGLALQAPQPEQIIYLEERIQNQYVRRGDPAQKSERAEPFRRSFDLAVMEPLKAID